MLATRNRVLLVAALCVLLIFGGQALGSASAPPAGSEAAASVGRAGFAYIGGLRRFAAAVLWNRLDPLSHEYYEGESLSKQTFMMPTFNMVTILDPQFEQAYYLASWVAHSQVSEEYGLEVAREGLERNPRSGMLTMNLAQLLFIQDADGNRAEVMSLVERIMTDTELVWLDDETTYEALVVARDAFSHYGDPATSARIEQALERLRSEGFGAGDHDHDGDGEQDH